MTRTLDEMIAALPAKRRAEVEARTAVLIAEERTYQDLRRAMGKTRSPLARRLRLKHADVIHIEGETDLLIATLERYVSALGGKIHFVAEFPDRSPCALSAHRYVFKRAADQEDRPEAGSLIVGICGSSAGSASREPCSQVPMRA